MAKNIINEENSSASFAGLTTNETYRVTSEIKFPLVVGESFGSDFEVRDAPVTPAGTLPSITFTKMDRVVTLTIPAFHGTLVTGNSTSLMRLLTPGPDVPTRFLPKFRTSFPVDAFNNGGLINVNQDHADLEIDTAGNIDLSAKSFFWNGNCGLNHDVHVTYRA